MPGFFEVDAKDYDWIKTLSWDGPKEASDFVRTYGKDSESVLERHKKVIPAELRDAVLKLLKDKKKQ